MRRIDLTANELSQFRDMVQGHRSNREIGEALGWARRKVEKMIVRHDIKGARGPNKLSGSRHPCWKGGRIRDRDGYQLLWMPTHPQANSGGYMREHRLVMEREVCRPLLPHEVVDHINGQRSDNRPENLKLYQSNAEHLRCTLKGRCPKWTPDGRARTQAGLQKWRDTRRQSRALDVSVLSEAEIRPKE